MAFRGLALGALGSITGELDQAKTNNLLKLWLEEHREKAKELAGALHQIVTRLDSFGDEIQERVESSEYLTLVRRTFRAWDQAETQEKRRMLVKLLTNAGAATRDIVKCCGCAATEAVRQSSFPGGGLQVR